MEYVEDYLGGKRAKPIVQKMMERDFESFVLLNLSELKKIVESLENSIGKSKVQEKLKRAFYSVVNMALS